MILSGQACAESFITKKADGSLLAASVGPAGVLLVNGVANGAVVTITGANPYKWAVTLPALNVGDLVQMYITATVDAIATAEFVWEDNVGIMPAVAGDEMDFVNAPNALAILAIQLGLAVPGDAMALTNAAIDAIWQELIAAHAAIAGSVAEALADAASCGLGSDGPVRTYTVTNSITGLPESAVYVRVTTDVAGLNTIRAGYTDVFGNFYPRLIAGTYYFWCTKQGFSEVQADQEVFV